MKRIFSLLLILAISTAITSAARANNRYLVTQSTPSDCGPAALATLLNYYLDIPATEAEMVKLTKSNPVFGTSLLGLEQAATAKGCSADSFRMSYETLQQQLATYPAPVIVRTLNPEPHFVVVLALDKDYVYVADPASGNILLRKESFLRRWYLPRTQEGYVFIAAAPHSYINSEHRAQIVKELAQQLRNLQTLHLPPSVFRR